MEYPFGHHSHTHQHHERREEEDYPPPPGQFPPPGQYPPPGQFPQHPFEQPPPPPPTFYPVNEPPRQETHVYHSSHVGGGSDYYDRPPPPAAGPGYSNYSDPFNQPPPPPPSAGVQHVSHHGFDESENRPHHGRPHMPSFFHHHTHHQDLDPTSKPSVRVFTKAQERYSLTIRDDKVILAPSDPSDPFQHWIKDEKFSTKVKDEEGFPSFALVNKATGQAMKHSIGATHPVQLIPYNPDVLDESVLWTESRDLGDSFRTIRMVNNIRLNVDAFNGDKNHGGVHDGTTIVLWEWKKGENQSWKIVPYCKSLNTSNVRK